MGVPFLLLVLASSGLYLPPHHWTPDQATVHDTVRDTALATITTDTGTFAPGHHDFSRYNTPGLCMVAAMDVRRLRQTRVDQRFDWTGTQTIDTIGSGAASNVAQRCQAQLATRTRRTTPPRDQLGMALFSRNDSAAFVLISQAMKQAPTARDRYEVWWNAISEVRHTGAPSMYEALLTRFDRQRGTLPPVIRLATVVNHLNDALDAHDTVRIQQLWPEVERFGKPTNRWEDDQPIFSLVEIAYSDALQNAAERLADGGPDSLPAIARRARQQLGTFSHQARCPNPDGRCQEPNVRLDYETMPLDTLLSELAPQWSMTIRMTHTPAPRLQADAWFPAPGMPPGDTVRPTAGHVNLICTGGELSNDLSAFTYVLRPSEISGVRGALGMSNWRDDWVQVGFLRRWLARYGNAGLSVTIVREARGWQDLYYNRTAGFAGILDAEREASFWQWYEQTYWELPVTVAVQQWHYQTLPPADGRRYRSDTTQFSRAFFGPRWAASATTLDNPEDYNRCVVIRRDGVIVYRGEEEANDVDHVLRYLFSGAHMDTSSDTPTLGK